MGHKVKLIPPQYDKPFVKSNKNDFIDAEAICEVSTRPNMCFVSIKSEEAQVISAIHKVSKLMNFRATKPFNVVTVALANKLARIAWAVMKTRQAFNSKELVPGLQ